MNLRNTLLRGIAAGAILVLPAILHAQSPRMVLVEEATNASCPPCAAQNPFFEHYLLLPHNQNTLIPITWHSNFPGRDVMNAANPTMHNGRVTYYGISGVPTTVVNGRVQPASSANFYDGAPADTLAIANGANQVRGTMSPITIAIDETRNGKDVTVNVTVSSTEALEGKTLQIVAVERHHNYASAGTNGEQDFFMVSRTMLPDLSGTALTLAAGESKTITQSYTIDAGWNPEQMHTVVFVQDDGTKEVLQAATNKTESSLRTSQTATMVMKTPGEEPIVWDNVIATNTAGEYIVTITPSMPADWTSTVTINGQTVTNGQAIQLGDSAPMIVSLDQATGRPGKGSVKVSIDGGRAGHIEETFKLYAGDIDVLVISRDEGDVRIPASYEAALKSSPHTYALVDANDEARFNFNDYKVLLIQSGKWILTEDDVNLLKNYIDNGGKLFAAGAEIAWALADPSATQTYRDVAFLNDYLHADYVADGDANNRTVSGVAGDPITAGMTFSIANGVPNQTTPDHISPREGAKAIFSYGTLPTPIAGIRYESGNDRMIYLGFGLEGIGDVRKRTDLITRGVNWLITGQATGVFEEPVTRAGMLSAPRPNPATGTFALPIDMRTAGHVMIALYNSRGEKVAVVADASFPAGPSAVSFDASTLPAGLYTAVMTADGATATERITIVR